MNASELREKSDQELRDELTAKGHTLASDTDTEVIVHLITQLLDDGLAPAEATAETVERLHGAFALGVIFAGVHDLMIGVRQGPPLAVGFGDGEMYLGSDALALAPLIITTTGYAVCLPLRRA